MIFLGISLDTWVQPAIAQTQNVVESILTAVSDKLSLWTSVGSIASLWCTICVLQSALPPAALPRTAPRPRVSLTQKMRPVLPRTGCRRSFLVEQQWVLTNAKTLSKNDSKRKWSLKLIGNLSVFILTVHVRVAVIHPFRKIESSSMLRFFECNLFCMAVQNSSANGWSQFSLSLGSNTRRMVRSEEQSQSAWSGVTWDCWVG